MHPFTEQLTQALAVVGAVPPSNHAANTDTQIAGIDLRALRRLITFCNIGTGITNVQLFYYSSANANMAGSTNLGNAAGFTVQILTGTTANRVESLEIRADQLPAGHRYVQPVMVVNSSAANVDLLCLASDPSYMPCNQFNVANVLDQGLVVT